MPLLFSLGQHAALQAVQDQLLEGERLFAFLGDIYVVTKPERVGHIRVHVASCAFAAAHFHPDQRWQNSSVERLSPDERVWRGSDLPDREQGIRVLGTPLGHPACVKASVGGDHQETSDFACEDTCSARCAVSLGFAVHCAGFQSKLFVESGAP